MNRNIRKIVPAAPVLPGGKRVAAYARVSGGKDAMLHSLSAQVSYYSAYIQKNPRWEYVGVYADEAYTGTKDTRAEFQRLLADCRAGRIDMVITKSISRFARNTVTLLEVVRELKSLDIDVFFEKENIHSQSGDGELMLTILASFAQEESRSVSENCKWRIRKRFQNGELVNLRFMYGYRISKDTIKIDREQAAVVYMIFEDYTNGMSCDAIAKKLREIGAKPFYNGLWTAKRVADILKNEKYTGNALLQKKYVTDHLSKALIRNNDVLPMYYAEGTHDAIVDMEMFQKAKAIMAERREKGNIKSERPNRYPFSGMIRCTRCGKNYKRKSNHGRFGWNCSSYLRFGKSVCHGKQIPEDILYAKTAEVLGIEAFDETVFKECVKELRVSEPGRLIYIFQDGHEIEISWQNKSRKNSWTEEMRQQARDRIIQRRRSGH